MTCKECKHCAVEFNGVGICVNVNSDFFGKDVEEDRGCKEAEPWVKDKTRLQVMVDYWHPLVLRPMSEKELEETDYEYEDIWACETPKEGEEVTVCYGDLIAFDIWHNATGFEVFGTAADAWMHSPKEYRRE